ncbi:MAG: hypothetical protein IPK69_09405 [Phycisphaerales bacterium]|nr:MAG: hypothetical protein IPK69_09405 [Phycisphaerales bacterium]
MKIRASAVLAGLCVIATLGSLGGVNLGIPVATAAPLVAPRAAPLAPTSFDPQREGSSTHQAETKKLEFSAFDNARLAMLTDWTGGPALTQGEIEGKVVLLAFWNDFIPAAKTAAKTAEKLAKESGSKGLIVILAHDSRGWAEATKPSVEGGALRVARDTDNALRKALFSDGDPDFYLIDRAGSLRFADITTASVEEGVKQLLDESADDAKAAKAKFIAGPGGPVVDFANVNNKADYTNLPEIPFKTPSEDEYTNAKWPPRPRDRNKTDEVAEIGVKPANVPDDGWIPGKPNLKGRITFYYFWHPDYFSGETSLGILNNLQRTYGRDVIFVVVVDLDSFNTLYGEKITKEQRDPERITKRMKELHEKLHQPQLYFLVDSSGILYKSIQETQNEVPFPYLAIASSDGNLRWWLTSDYIQPLVAIDKMLRVDPGVQARRKVEQEYILKGGK